MSSLLPNQTTAIPPLLNIWQSQTFKCWLSNTQIQTLLVNHLLAKQFDLLVSSGTSVTKTLLLCLCENNFLFLVRDWPPWCLVTTHSVSVISFVITLHSLFWQKFLLEIPILSIDTWLHFTSCSIAFLCNYSSLVQFLLLVLAWCNYWILSALDWSVCFHSSILLRHLLSIVTLVGHKLWQFYICVNQLLWAWCDVCSLALVCWSTVLLGVIAWSEERSLGVVASCLHCGASVRYLCSALSADLACIDKIRVLWINQGLFLLVLGTSCSCHAYHAIVDIFRVLVVLHILIRCLWCWLLMNFINSDWCSGCHVCIVHTLVFLILSCIYWLHEILVIRQISVNSTLSNFSGVIYCLWNHLFCLLSILRTVDEFGSLVAWHRQLLHCHFLLFGLGVVLTVSFVTHILGREYSATRHEHKMLSLS